jgi:uncharacterized integral membrane protein
MTGAPESSGGKTGRSGAHRPRAAANGSRGASPGHSRSESVRLMLVGALAALAVAFAALNVNQVEVDWILDTTKTPLIVVIVVSLLVGAVLGFVVARRSTKARSRSAPAEHRA